MFTHFPLSICAACFKATSSPTCALILLAVVLLLLPIPSSPQHTQTTAVLVGSGTSRLQIELDLGYVRKHQLNQSVSYLKCASLARTGDVFLHHQVVLLGFWIKGEAASMCPLWR